ncbi:hypothetical protein DSLASN_07970 [Desulfoluna limicola]|uniref:histidine kinase n=1 Tax=Desulfoluna limicola TaxID=2810562 RepID=A0ABN6F1N1_9BACT|nr:ATP-binding protein [Desulfoluna limicola]BCS95165.1 hypothetical protein DSLASN_07970 [Desulfoluna limicola]
MKSFGLLDSKYPIINEVDIPKEMYANWQSITNLLARIAGVPAALIMRVHPHEIEVFACSQSEGMVYTQGERASLNTGLYCETVMDTRNALLVPDATRDPAWQENPDMDLGMISYFGMPITWPTDDIFGTICILDAKPNAYSEDIRELLTRFRDSVQFSLQVLYQGHLKGQAYEETLHTWDSALKAVANAIVITDPEGIVLWVNPAFTESSGYEAREVVGHRLERIQSGKHGDAFYKTLWETIRQGKVWKGEFLNQRKDGSLYNEAATITPVKNKRGDIVQFIAVTQDITELKKLEEQLRHAHKMDAIGQLSAGIAHDFNNMLGGILGASELLASEIPNLNEEAKEYVEIIIQSSTRAANLTRKLLAFSRKSKLTSTAVDLHAVIEETASLLSQSLDKRITISVENKAENHRVIGDDTQLQNALMNLGINASHAMPAGGELWIDTRDITLDRPFCDATSFCIEPGRYLEINIGDTGHGITPENLDKIFDPFFTTKGQGKGTGLGLAAVHSIMRDHHGAVTVSSEPGVGTQFHLYLPLTDDIPMDEGDDQHVEEGSGTILVVDDEKIIRITAKAMLEQMGYTVLLAKNGEEALEVFQKSRDDIDLVVLDMVMPVKNGRETFAGMKGLAPECRVILSSGFSRENSIEDLKSMGLSGFIRKPFRQWELSRLISDVLKQ